MKVDFSAIIFDLEGRPIKDGEKNITLGLVACTSLLAIYPDEQGLGGEEKVKRFRLAEIAVQGGEQDVAVEDVTLIKRLVGKAYAPLIVGRVYGLIEGHGSAAIVEGPQARLRSRPG